jgi:hypothetical protein
MRRWRPSTPKGDDKAAIIFVNKVDGDRFRKIDQIGGDR